MLTNPLKIREFVLISGLLFVGGLALIPTPSWIDTGSWKIFPVIFLMLYWWTTEAVPIAVTALIPIALFPLLGDVPLEEVAKSYAHPLIFLFMGGFFLAAALTRWNLHKRIALSIVCRIGTDGKHVIGGFMLATAFLSMWISNTATTVMMLPIALSVVQLFLEDPHIAGSDKDKRNFAIAMVLAIAYAASIGGISTLIGTPPNAILAAYIQSEHGIELDFARWFVMAFPCAAVLLLMAWWVLVKLLFKSELGGGERSAELIREELRALGKMRFEEKVVAVVFAIAAFSWIGREGINNAISVSGMPLGELSDSGIAMIAALTLFLIPSRKFPGQQVMDWKTAETIPWGILLLFGGGLALASALGKSPMVGELAGLSAGFLDVHVLLVVLVVTALMLFLTELMSNMALTTLFLPIVAVVAITLGESPLLFAIPVTLASSCAFMMPIATPPNAIVFASNHVTVPQMMKAGLVLNLLALIAVLLAVRFIAVPVFGI